jgi:hypothetical protein
MKQTRIETLEKIEYRSENGEFHREDGPAYEEKDENNYKSWWINGKRHREDGPAKVAEDGLKEYFLNNIKYSKEQWELEVLKIRLERLKTI